MHTKFFSQENGDRLYKLENSVVRLLSGTVDKAKLWNNRYKSNIYDSKFIQLLAIDLFGRDSLARSSVFGGRSWNSNIQHAALDEVKIRFVQGNVTYCQLYQIFFFAELSLIRFWYILFIFDRFI